MGIQSSVGVCSNNEYSYVVGACFIPGSSEECPKALGSPGVISLGEVDRCRTSVDVARRCKKLKARQRCRCARSTTPVVTQRGQ